jgi:hypothetical protein
MSRKMHLKDITDDSRDEAERSVPPEDDTDLQIVPVSDKEEKEGGAEKDRHIIHDILKGGVGLPWVHQSKNKIGQA